MNEWIKTARSAVSKNPRFFLRRQPRNFENTTLVARRRKHFWVFLAIFLVAQISPKRGLLVHKNSLASCQRYRHSVEPRALTCPFKHSDLIAWSLLSGHPTHKYLWGRLCFVQACCLLSTVTVTPAENRIMSTEALLSKMVSVKILRSAWAPGSRVTKQLKTVATRVIAATESFYFARGIGSQALVGAAVDEERWAGKTHLPASLVLYLWQLCYMCWHTLFLMNCFGIAMVLCNLYLKRFDLTEGLLFKTFVITDW